MNIRPAESDVKKFLRAALRQRARAVVSLEVKARAVELLSEDQHITDARVFKRAKKSLGIKSLRAGFGARSRWLWQLPQLNQEAQEEEAAPLVLRNIVQWVARFRRAESSEIGVVADHSPALILSTASRSCDCSLSFRGRQTC